MASIKSINLLPEIFRTDTNKKFLAATVDQLISEPDLKRINGFVGRTFAPTYRYGDSYIEEPSTDRQNYQLESSFVVQDQNQNVVFYSSYLDLIQKISYYGGLVNNHSRLFENESYNFNGLFDFDKFVNFNQYYWLPDGPPEVAVSANATTEVLDFQVTRDTKQTAYTFSGSSTDPNPVLALVKGSVYRFTLNQPENKFWIQTSPGKTGTRSSAAEELSRQIFGVENNGDDSGVIIFNVPASDAQDTLRFAERVATVNFATTLTYAQVQNHLLTVIKNSGGIDGAYSRTLDGCSLIFLTRTSDDEDWKDQGTFDFDRYDQDAPYVSSGYEQGNTVSQSDRYDIFRIRVTPVGATNGLVQLEHIQSVDTGQKVYVSGGTNNAAVEFYKNSEGYWETVSNITAPLTELYYQDDTSDNYAGVIQLIEPTASIIDVENNILGRKNYTSPNGVKFTNGLKIRFDNTATPSIYANSVYIVEGVGRGIRLVNTGSLIVPEEYALEDALATPDYITVARGSQDLNAWSRSNRWFHSEIFELAAEYNQDADILLTTATRASRPIIEFEPDLYLFNYGQRAKAPVDVLDYTVTDAFKEVEGKENYTITLPNNVSRTLTAGTRIIFAADKNPEVRNRIYRVDFITTLEKTAIHLVSENTELLPTYQVDSVQIVEDTNVVFVGGNPDFPAQATLSVDSVSGEILDMTFTNVGVNYRSSPTVSFVGGGVGTGAEISVTVEDGSISNYEIVSAGQGYAVAPVYGFVPTVSFSRPVPGIGAVQATGTATMVPTTVANTVISYCGLNYVADPYLKINTSFVDAAQIDPVYSNFKYVDHIRITNPGSGVGVSSVATISSPNALEKISDYGVSANANTFTSSIIRLDDTTNLLAGQFVFGQGITGGTKIQNVLDSNNVQLTSPASVAHDRTYVFKASSSLIKNVSYANASTFSSNIVSFGSLVEDTTGIIVGQSVLGIGINSTTVVQEILVGASAGNIRLSNSVELTNNRGFLFETTAINLNTIAANNNVFSSSLLQFNSVTGVLSGYRVYGEGVPVGTTVSDVFGNLAIKLSNIVQIRNNRSYTFSSPSVLAATVRTLSRNSDIVEIDNSNVAGVGMYVTGGITPLTIDNITTDNPVIITTVDAHGLVDGDSIVIRGVVGTTELNNNTYWVQVIDSFNLRLYADQEQQVTLDGRNYGTYVSSGVVAAYTIEYGVAVKALLGENVIQLSSPVSVKIGTVLNFVGKTAQARVNTDSNEVYSVTVTDSGAGYTSVPSVTLSYAGVDAPAATAVMNNSILEYFKVVYAGSGYQIGQNITTEIISSVTLQTATETTYGSTVLTFNSVEEISYIKENWLALLVVEENQNISYRDFARVPYTSTETTGPDPDNFKNYMDVALTSATVLAVSGIQEIINEDDQVQYQITLNGSINSLDSDGEQINLPTNSKIFFTAKNRYFTDGSFGSDEPVGETKSGYSIRQPVSNSTIIPLEDVSGIQKGMLVRDLSNSIGSDVIVESVDVVNREITLTRRISAVVGLPLEFSTVTNASVFLNSTKVQSVEIDGPGAEYTSAPTITIEPAVPSVQKIISSTGVNRILVTDLDGIIIGMTVFSEYNSDGNGVTTGAAVPRVIGTETVQTGLSTFEYYVILNQVQPVFEGLLATFNYATKAIALIETADVVETETTDITPDTYELDDTVIIASPTVGQSAIKQRQVGVNTYNQYWYDGETWIPAQQKTQYNQAPLFDLFDATGVSIADTETYTGSKFGGSKIFSYKQGTGAKDSQLGFALNYKNFQNVGDIEFENNYEADSFALIKNKIEVFLPLNQFLLKQQAATGFVYRNIWTKSTEKTKQYQIITKFFDGNTNYFEIDILPASSETVPYIKVYVDNVLLSEDLYTVSKYEQIDVVIIDQSVLSLDPLSKIDILIYSPSVSQIGYYQIPSNIDLNTENVNFNTLTLGQLRQHLVAMTQNNYGLQGSALAKNNLRDLEIKNWTGCILQHASPAMYSALALGDQGFEFIESIELAQKEYTKFKNKFLDQALKQQIDLTDIPQSVDRILDAINIGKNTTMPWYDSDMIPYGNAFTKTRISIVDIRQRRYQIPSLYNDTVPSRRSVLVYLKDDSTGITTQLIKNLDFTFNQSISAIDLSTSLDLSYTQYIELIDRPSTVGSYVPETPTKLGLHPSFVPQIFVDDTYQVSKEVIQGHDGSVMPTFGDYRDQLLLELELRIYNNIKVKYTNTILDIVDSIPGKFRKISYSRAEFNQLLTRNFLRWIGTTAVDYTSNTTFQSNNAWTWNYRFLKDADGESLPGFWRGIYFYFFDTDKPHLNPWEMLGFYEKPIWWEDRYGPAPYTGSNAVLWDDLENGYIAGGERQGIDTRFSRPGLSRYIPVDEFGQLKSPEKFAPASFDSSRLASSWAIGDHGPAETAWRRSSEYPFALQMAIALSRPAFYFSSMSNTVAYLRDANIDQLVFTDTKQRITKDNFSIPDDGLVSSTVNLTAGYVNWIRDWFTNKAINGTEKIQELVRNVNVKLSYKMAGYSDNRFLTVIADQSSPVNEASSIILPNENYKIFLNKSAPVEKITYSAVVIERTTTGYAVRGYDVEQPYFTIIPSKVNNNTIIITAIEERATVYRDFEPTKVVVPYGFEFSTRQQVVDFLISYSRYLIAQGFVFDTFNPDLETRQDWVLSAREFLTWSQQGWKNGNLLILSPILNSFKIINTNGVIDHIANVLSGSKILDQNFNIIKNSQFSVVRDENAFVLTSVFGQTIGFASLNLIQYEHVLLLDNNTVFGDVVYQPELGNRQYRLRLIGSKTNNWTGQLNPFGFIYNSDAIDEWQAGRNYRKGSLVSFKEKFYYAVSNVPASTDFDFTYWSNIAKDKIKTGLLPNFSYNAEKFNTVYDIDETISDEVLDELSTGITGFRQRSYFQDFKLDNISQSKFYQGYIKQKGTINAVDALTTAQFDNLFSTIDLYEEWALRVGDYGALGSDQSIEFQLTEDSIRNNPSTLVLLNQGDADQEGLINVRPADLYRTTEDRFTKTPVAVRTDVTPRVSDSITAGYPRLDDVDATIFDILDYADYADLVRDIGSGYKIWVAKDFNKNWNIYRVSETDVLINQLQVGLDNRMTVITDKPHGLIAGTVIVIKNFDLDYDGFYQVIAVTDNNSFTVEGYKNLQRLKSQQKIEGIGILLTLTSVRFSSINQLVNFVPRHGWKNQDRVWVDNDTADDVWAVFEKNAGWQFDDILPLRGSDTQTNQGYGETVAISNDQKIIIGGIKDYTTGGVSGLRIIWPGFLYAAPTATFSSPDSSSGKTTTADLETESGTLLRTRVTSSGSNYNILPNITIVDENTITTLGNVYQSNTIPLASLTVTVSKTPAVSVSNSSTIELTNINDVWVGDTVSGNDTAGNSIASAVVANINYTSNTITLTSDVSWSTANAQTLSFTHRLVYLGDVVTGTDNTGNVILSETTVTAINTLTNTIETGVRTNSFNALQPIKFSRGTGGNVQARFAPTSIASIEVLNGGSGFVTPPLVEIVGGGGTGAQVTVNLITTGAGVGSIDSFVIVSGGSGYTYPPEINLITTNLNHGAVFKVKLTPTSVENLVVAATGSGYKHPHLIFSTPAGGTGSGAAGNVSVTNQSIISAVLREFGQGYSRAPSIVVTDGAGDGAGAEFEVVQTTGTAVAFERSEGLFNQIQNIRPFGSDAVEFGYSVDIGTNYAFVGAPGSFGQKGAVLITKSTGTNWVSQQVLYNLDEGDLDRFGHSVVIADDQSWLYVGAPGANKVFAYGRKTTPTNQQIVQVVENQISYLTKFNFIKTVNELKVIGTSGKVYEAGFDYSLVAGTLTFRNFEIISAETALYLTQTYPVTVIVPTVIRGILQTSYLLSTTPVEQEQINVVGADGRILIYGIDYDITGVTINFLNNEFADQASLTVGVLDNYYVLIDILEPTDQINWISSVNASEIGRELLAGTVDTYAEMVAGGFITGDLIKVLNLEEDGTYDSYQFYRKTVGGFVLQGEENRAVTRGVAKFGWSLAIDNEGYQLIVGAPEAAVDVDNETLNKVGKIYIFDREYQTFVGSVSGQNIYYSTLQEIEDVTKITVDGIELFKDLDYTISGSTVSFVAPPRSGAKIKVDINKFSLIQKIENPDPVKDAQYGISVALSKDRNNIFVGAPGYKDLDYYNGKVYRYVNEPYSFGRIVGTKGNLAITQGDYIRINDIPVVLQSTNNDTLRPVKDINSRGITGIFARTDGVNDLDFLSDISGQTRGSGYFESNVAISIDPPDQIENGVQATVGNITLYANGAIDSFVITSRGSGYTFTPNVVVTGANSTIARLTAVTSTSQLGVFANASAKSQSISILPGFGTALEDLGLEIYTLTQEFQHPDLGVPERFGKLVKVDNQTGETLLISSEGGVTLKSSTFDNNSTVFDKSTTNFIDILKNAGAVYVYDFLPIPNQTIENPSQYLYNQVLQNSKILFNDNFGSAIDIRNNWIIAGATKSDFYTTDAGLLHLFVNEENKKGWSKLRIRNDKVDIDYINQAFVYNKQNQTIIKDLDYFDPAKGKILGIADQDLDYKTAYDPAVYNRGSRQGASFDENSSWTEIHIGNTWWDLDLCRYIDYEQGDLNYRVNYWGELFPGSTVEVCEWVESFALPSEYATLVGAGEAKYPDNSAYVEFNFLDSQSGLIRTKYYYWVKNKNSVDSVRTKRFNSITAIENAIEFPKNQNLPYVAVVSSGAFSLYNVNDIIFADNSVFKLEYATSLNDNISHSEYELVQQGNPNSLVPEKYINKLIDSLSGENSTGEVVPDLRLKENDQLGIGIRPRQTMIKNANKAIEIFVDYVNRFLKKNLIVRYKDISKLKAQEPVPADAAGFYNQVVDTVEQLYFIETSDLLAGYKVLVNSDANYEGFWTIYEYTPEGIGSVWLLNRIQSYDSNRFWGYADWYAEGYDSQTKIDYIVQEFKDIVALDLQSDNIIRVLDDGNGQFELYRVNSDLTVTIIGVENGTIQLNSSLYNYDESLVGFDNPPFDSVGFSKTAAIEMRNIIRGLIDGVFTDTDIAEINNTFFVLINYILSEQRSLDWLIKTSLLSVVHQIRRLEQFPSYIRDQQDYFASYIDEVKPYRTQVRNYLLNYLGDESLPTVVDDFDLTSVYDYDQKRYRTLNINNTTDANVIAQSASSGWLENYKYKIESIQVVDAGSGYTRSPTITIIGGGGTGATAVATVNTATGQVIDIDLVNSGSGYTSTPTVIVEGGGGFGARAYVVLSTIGTTVISSTVNKAVRNIKTKLSFDRISYSSQVSPWKPYKTFRANDIVIVNDVTSVLFDNLQDQLLPRYSYAYQILKTVLGSSTINLNLFNDASVVKKLSGDDIDNAVDRVAIYNRPGSPDIATLYSSPDSIRLDSSITNEAASSQSNEWNKVVHSLIVPRSHEYQYLAIGNRAYIAISKTGNDWIYVPVAENQIDLRDACFFAGNTWIAVGNQGTLLASTNATFWTKEQVTEFKFSPSADTPTGAVQLNANQVVDFVGVSAIDASRSSYVIAVGNGNSVLMNPYNTSLDLEQGWYSAKPQTNVFGIPRQFLTIHSVNFGTLTDNDGSTYTVDLQSSGFFTTGTQSKMKQGFVVIGGVNGNMFITSFNRLDDLMQGYAKTYNYDSGKLSNENYPWIPMAVPNEVQGLGDNVSGEQISSVSISTSYDRWIVAVGSGGTLLWNKLDSPIEVQTGSADLASDTINKTVVDYGVYVYKNFRYFNADNFAFPLTPDVLSKIDLTDIVWDNEKFVVTGTNSTTLWGFPGSQSEAYIELGNINPSEQAQSRSVIDTETLARWDAVSNGTSVTVTIDGSALSGFVIPGMTVISTHLPNDSVVTSASYSSVTGEWTIVVSFANTSFSARTEQSISFAYAFTANISAGTTLTFSGPNGQTKALVTSRPASKGDTTVYVENFDKVQANWTISGIGIPTGARVKQIGRFANFTWQYAQVQGQNNNVDYNSITVNTTTVQLNQPFTANIPSGSVITFFDTTGTKSQLTVVQDLQANTTTLAFANALPVGVNYSLEANANLGILGGTQVISTKLYAIGGVLNHLYKDIPDLVPGTSYNGVKVTGQAYTDDATDILSLDTTISSSYTDSQLGVRPEDIIINGGKFIDTYSSHAPEELVPGQVIDSLQMNVFTANVVNGNIDYGNVIAYKIFTDYKLPTVYYRLSAANTAVLVANLSYDATEIAVDDASKLPEPNAVQNQPGSVWVNSEKINYFGIDYDNNLLTDIRRGALRTSIPMIHEAGSIITDASQTQIVTKDTVLSITSDYEVRNGFSSNANVSVYRSVVTTSVPQSQIWLEPGT